MAEPIELSEALAELGYTLPYVETFASPAAEWIVNHNRGVQPTSVTVMTPGGVEVVAQVLHVSPNQCRVNFASPQAGVVRCS